MFKKILVPTDGSTRAGNALRLAIDLARSMGSKVIVVHAGELAYPPMPADYTAWSPVFFRDMAAEFHKRGNRILDEARQLASESQIPTDTRLEIGTPIAAICALAEKEDCDLIVMGSRGLSDLKGLFLGSVSHGVLQRSRCPVLLVKEAALSSEENKIKVGAAEDLIWGRKLRYSVDGGRYCLPPTGSNA